MAERIIDTDITEELQKSFLDYSMSVITDRALPDVRSGLKPVHTRILYSAYTLGMLHDKPYKKSARLVGDTLGRFHPHGDSSVYQAIVKLVQNFSIRYPLIDGEGSWGSQDGDEAAAQRYTLCRLSKYGELMLEGIKNNTIDFKMNFSNDEKEPTVLPSLLPNLIVNGTTGIAVGMACKFAPHNLKEVCDALCYYLSKGADINNITLDEILNFIQGPDFPTGCKIINKDSLKDFYACGKGTIKIQGKYKIEKQKNSKHFNIIFYEIPYGVSKEKLISKIADLCSKGEVSNIIDIRDETTQKSGIRFVIETSFAEQEQINNLVNLLFDKTDLETSFSINQNALVDGSPRLLNLLEIIDYYIKFQQSVLLREFKNEYEKLSIQYEKLNGLLIALEDIDNIIAIIKSAENKNEAKIKLIEKYNFTEIQVNAILDMKLSKLTKIDSIEIQKNKNNIELRLSELKSFIEDKNKLNEQLILKISNMRNLYGDERRTEIVNEIREKKSSKKDIIDEETFVVITNKGDIKRFSSAKKASNSIVFSIKTNVLNTICLFSNKGICYKIPVRKIPIVLKTTDKGEKLSNFNIKSDEQILKIMNLNELNCNLYIITKFGYYKGLNLEECNSNRTVKYTSLKEDDEVVYTSLSEKEISLKTNKKDRKIKNFVILKRTALGNKNKDWEENEFIEQI